MGWNTDFEVSTTVLMAIFEVELNVSEFHDLNCKPDGGATGITSISTFGHVPAVECWIWLNVADDARLYNATGKQIIVTGAPNIATGVNEITGSIRLYEGGGWMVFDRTNSTAYPDMGQVNVSWTWGINDMPHCSGHGIVFRDYGPRYYYGDLDCDSWQRIGVNRAELLCCQPSGGWYTDSDPSRHGCTPLVCCASPAGRIVKKGGRS